MRFRKNSMMDSVPASNVVRLGTRKLRLKSEWRINGLQKSVVTAYLLPPKFSSLILVTLPNIGGI